VRNFGFAKYLTKGQVALTKNDSNFLITNEASAEFKEELEKFKANTPRDRIFSKKK
jgi:hypothetical protein